MVLGSGTESGICIGIWTFHDGVERKPGGHCIGNHFDSRVFFSFAG